MNDPVCTCDLFVHPTPIVNAPGLRPVSYRLGDFLSFRHALLLGREGEEALRAWRPGAEGDLAVQLVEWWSVLADVLGFYNERIAQESWLGTATLPESVTNLIRLIGYRPRPAIAGHGTVAALVSGNKPVTLPKGFAIQSKPGPGKKPQVFEVDADTNLQPPGLVNVDPPADPKLFRPDADGVRSSVLVAGSVGGVKSGNRLLLRARTWSGEAGESRWATVAEVRTETSPRGKKNTRIVFDANLGLDDQNAPNAADWLLLRSSQTARLFTSANEPIALITEDAIVTSRGVARTAVSTSRIMTAAAPTATTVRTSSSPLLGEFGNFVEMSRSSAVAEFGVIGVGLLSPVEFVPRVLETAIHLEAAQGGIEPGDAFVLERPGTPSLVACVDATTREIWYANADDPAAPETKPAGTNVVPIAVFHTVVQVKPILKVPLARDAWNQQRAAVTMRFGWSEVATLIGTPAATFAATFAATSSNATLVPTGAPPPAVSTPRATQLEDANGAGTPGRLDVLSASAATLSGVTPLAPPLAAPLRLLTDLLTVSRGKSVTNEVLGSGDATIASQELLLQKAPLTYLQSGDGYRSTLIVRVGGVAWTEVPSFYGQPADARVFVTKEDAEQKTHVLFGDGVNGARLPSGTNNVVASYRYGGGAEMPEAGSLTVVLHPQPGLRSIRNPVAVFGGSDPDDPEKIRKYAPRSVLTFGRAVSGDDYEVMAAQAPGVRRASADWAFDATQQRAMVTVWVGDDAGAVASARAAILGSGDPNRHFVVQQATPADFALTLTIVVAADRDPEQVKAAVDLALRDPDAGLLGANAVRIGKAVYDSEIHRACLAVPGAVAVHALQFSIAGSRAATPRHDPGPGRFFRLTTLTMNTVVQA